MEEQWQTLDNVITDNLYTATVRSGRCGQRTQSHGRVYKEQVRYIRIPFITKPEPDLMMNVGRTFLEGLREARDEKVLRTFPAASGEDQ